MLTFVSLGIQLNIDPGYSGDSVPAVISRPMTSQEFALPTGSLEQKFWKKNQRPT